MAEAELFELIRKEQIILWAGAGMSRYAGYPVGSKLKELVFDQFNEVEKSEIDSSQKNLAKLCELLEQIRQSREPLLDLLKQEFEHRQPSSLDIHEKLKKIPHIKTIITTNYDYLFEITYGETIQVVVSDQDLPKLDSTKTHLFKIHGDTRSDRLIITEGDYNKFYQEELSSLIWATIKDRFASKSILFIGYGFEDENIINLYERVIERLGNNINPSFLVAPGLSQFKQAHLQKLNVNYINSTAEELFLKIEQDLKDNIVSDYEKGHVSADIFREYLSYNNLIPDLKGQCDRFILQSLSGKTGEIRGKIKFTVDNDNRLLREIKDFFSGNEKDKLEIPNEKLWNFLSEAEGIRLNSFEQGISNIEFHVVPSLTDTFDIIFEDDLALTNLNFKLFKSPKRLRFDIEYKGSVLKIIYYKLRSKNNVTFSFSPTNVFQKTNDAFLVYKFLFNFMSNVGFTAYYKSGHTIKYNFFGGDDFIKYIKPYLDFYEKLRRIEKHYKVRFSNFTPPTEEINKSVNHIILAMEKRPDEMDWSSEITIDYIPAYEDRINNNIEDTLNPENVIAHFLENEVIVSLYGHSFNLGFQLRAIIDPVLVNDKEIRKNLRRMSIKSNCDKMLILYLKDKSEFPSEKLNGWLSK